MWSLEEKKTTGEVPRSADEHVDGHARRGAQPNPPHRGFGVRRFSFVVGYD
jgi:hypothetical protein